LAKCNKQIRDKELDLKDLKTKSKILRESLTEIAKKTNIELKLRRK